MAPENQTMRQDAQLATRFAILAAPRTGSNWLCSLLDSHPEVLCHHEIFNPGGFHVALSRRGELGLAEFGLADLAHRDRDPAAVLAKLWRRTFGCRAVGFKITREQPREVFAAVFADPGIRVVLLHRRNRLRTFVSERIAAATGCWESYPGQRRQGEPAPIDVRLEELAAHAALNESYYAGLTERLDLAGHWVLETHYEALGESEEQRRILDFLGVAPGQPLAAATRKQGPRELRHAIANFDTLTSELAGSPFAAEFDAPEP